MAHQCQPGKFISGFYIIFYLLLCTFVATSSLHQAILQEDDWLCLLCKSWCQAAFLEANSWSHHQNIQATDVYVEGLVQCKSFFPIPSSCANYKLSGPCCNWWSQLDTWRVTCGKLPIWMGTLLSLAIGLRKAPWIVDGGACISWFHSTEYHSQWDKTWAGTIQGL